MSATVSFVIPCYKLAHVLGECIDSILAQTHTDLEILVMDDQSPDETPEVVRKYADPRVIHIRNEKNLGHLANYNKGIGMARGQYVWLISADDSLLSAHVLERFVGLMERIPSLGYIFCPVIPHVHHRTVDISPFWYRAPSDAVLEGRVFLERLAESNCVPAPAVLVRKACYERAGVFPLDLPYAGDWYMWCLFAAYYDVAYLAEPMVRYRWHEDNLTHQLRKRDRRILDEDELKVRWRVARLLDACHLERQAAVWWKSLAQHYATLVERRELEGGRAGLSLAEAAVSCATYAARRSERSRVAGQVFGTLADRRLRAGRVAEARNLYGEALKKSPASPRSWAKFLLSCAGRRGVEVRRAITHARHGIDW